MSLMWGGLGLAVLGGTLAYFADQEVNDNNSKAKSAGTEADFNTYSTKAKSAQSSRSLHTALAGAGLLGFGVSFAF